MGTMLAHVANAEHIARGQLILCGEVPLLNFGRADVRVPQPDSGAFKRAARADETLIKPGAGQITQGGLVDGFELRVDRRIHGQTQIGTCAFHERGDGVGTAKHKFPPSPLWSPGEADTRLEILSVRGIEPAAIAVFTSKFHLAAEQTEIYLAVLDLHPRRAVIP